MQHGLNSVIFILFFGSSLIEALVDRNGWFAALFILLGLLFLYADTRKHTSHQ